MPSVAPELVGKAVTPFLRDHIPGLYAPLGKRELASMDVTRDKDSNSKYCYRHRPDAKCRRVADEAKMSKIQRVSGLVVTLCVLSIRVIRLYPIWACTPTLRARH